MTRKNILPLALILVASISVACKEECDTRLPDVFNESDSYEGCVQIGKAVVTNGATLTIRPGTTVDFLDGGYLHVNPDGSGAALIAVSEPHQERISFTSAHPEAEPGDWQCVRIDQGSTRTSIAGAEFEFGGAECEIAPGTPRAMLVLNSEIEKVHRTDFRLAFLDRSTGTEALSVLFERDGRVRERISDSSFAGGGVRLGLNAVLSMGSGNVFRDAGDFIPVETTSNLTQKGDWLPQPVPYRLLRDPSTGELQATINVSPVTTPDPGPVVIKAGTEIQMDHGSLIALASTVIVEGTEGNEVVFTSAEEDPAPGNWGCLLLDTSPPDAPSSIIHALIEYAGSGIQCTGARYSTAVKTNRSTSITNTTFRELAGTRASSSSNIWTPLPCPSEPGDEAWCRVGNDFDDSVHHIDCSGNRYNCVVDGR